MTNLYKTRENIIYELILSLNKGSSGVLDARVDTAIQQYNSMVKKGIIVEISSEDKEYNGSDDKEEELMPCNHKWVYLGVDKSFATCSKCGVLKPV